MVTEFFDAINERRLDDLGAYMAADVVDHNKIIFGEPDEPGAAFEGIRMQLDAFDPFHIEVEEVVAEGEKVVARIRMTGTHSGTHPRMPVPTGRSFEVEAIFLLTLREGRISEIRAVSDRLGMFFQLGWDWPEAD
ncbi:MAG: SnoaL-like domain-containing protein [Nonomuraea sp.]|nr:SnoaL-like domain-containing protein [Nonomuraea sp.]NUP60565.1 SnoaL-like domain-containing protein [Nonomuraea sp.]NUP82592.1 SnoaL-like domain-containing protein [Nonomuraea sp.]NUT40548.1 SnoaL-like domain-containing protein [Thermoactinospora sp.]